MNKTEYFTESLKNDKYQHKAWYLRSFSVTDLSNIEPAPWELAYGKVDDTHYYVWVPDESGVLTKQLIEDSNVDEPLLKFSDAITATDDLVINCNGKSFDTTLGNVIYNKLCLALNFGKTISFVSGKVDPFKIEKKISLKMVDGVDDKPASVSVDAYINYGKSINLLDGLTQIAAPAGSPKTVTVDPMVIKRRDELFKEYEGRLNDPVVVAKIGTELEQLDRESFKGDPSEDFFIKSKSFGVVRKKLYMFLGTESGFDDGEKSNFIRNSLKEGWDFEFQPDMVNASRAGSFNRGSLTALGGESVKYFYRMFQNKRISQKDCGSKHGLFWKITKDNVDGFLGLYEIVSGKPVEITEDRLSSLIGTTTEIRSPMSCKTPDPGYCETCCGKALSMSPNGLHIAASDVGSIFMGIFMASMHGKALRTRTIDLKKLIT